MAGESLMSVNATLKGVSENKNLKVYKFLVYNYIFFLKKW